MLTEKQEDIFIDKLKETGRWHLSAMWAGTTRDRVEEYCSTSPDFKRACKLAVDMYVDSVVSRIEKSGYLSEYGKRMETYLKRDKNGNLSGKIVLK